MCPVTAVCLDGTYDTEACIDELLGRHIDLIIPPRRDAVAWPGNDRQVSWTDYPRNQAITRTAQMGRKAWDREVSHHLT